MKKIGIMGGTFDPPHIGHLLMAEYAKETLGLDIVIFIPTGKTKYKDKITSATDRYNMVSLAISGRQKFIISDIEILSDDYSYTAETLRKMNISYADSQLYFIVGADSLDYMEKWKNPEIIFSSCKVVAIKRRGYSDNDVLKKANELFERFSADIVFIDMPLIDISSTEIRDRILNAKSIRYMVPDKVRRYIIEKNLYIGEQQDA